eukprot:TRINITY_DN5704_c0_g1_i3.p1 TRINITY_DN5704_c0_g1~~TRINITY_DN5704_c0_g1_i3.p1  ORF type:complete len:228 (+),score=33.42 TRINITY_DN5704_c0_g1_i3:111-794(+)
MNNARNDYGRQVIQISTVSRKTRQPFKSPYPPIDTTTGIDNESGIRGSPDIYQQPMILVRNQPAVRPEGDPDVVRREDVALKADATEILEPVSETIPFSRMNFCGILISSLVLIGSLAYVTTSVLFAFDKKGKEAYYADNTDTELTLKEVFESTPNPSTYLKTDYWGWFQRAHDEDSILNEYDVFYFILIVGAGCGAICAIISIVEICKYKNDSTGRATCVRHCFKR